jgi:biopolymer transport protein ExbD
LTFARITEDKRNRKRAYLPITPMIDVVFLLLIYFMVTSSMTPSESRLESAIQTESKGGSGSDLQPQIVFVEMRRGASVFRVGQRVLTTKGDLLDVLRQLPKDGGVFIRVDDLVPVSAAAAAMQASKDAGFTKVTYVPAG